MEGLPSSRFTWTIENFSRLNIKQYSKIFIVGGYKWRVSIFPKGNNVDHLSMYLDVADSVSLPYGWSRYAQFSLAVINQVHSKYTIRKDTQCQFNSQESDWGFKSFMPLSDLYDQSRGYLVNDTVVVEAEVVVHKVFDYWTYDSKKETGYVGLKNQGTTCYMNSLLQTLYHIPYFRKAVYHMPTTENDIPSGSIPLALQSLFFRLQYSDNSVATKELTKSFGWNTNDSFIQHDVQELNRVLCEKLEDKMKGTVAEGTIQQLFEGHHMNYIKCINVDYEFSQKESFYDLQLDVNGCRDVYASFDKYVEVVRLEGDKKYHAEQYGLQDAKKGALFVDFPPVLQLQLKRFKYDFMRDTMVKINDKYEFPLQLDLDSDNGKYLSTDADRSVRNLYTLHSVLVHSGGVHGGHYYAFIRPILSDQWFMFDDDRVTKEKMERAMEEQYGGEKKLSQTNPSFNKTPFKFPNYSNAYMLVYIRESDKDKIICSVDEKDIAKHLKIILKKEQEEKEHKEKAEAHLYTIIKVAQDEDLAGQIGKDIYFDLVDHDKVRNFRIKKQMLFKAFKEEVAKEFGIPVQFQRFWLWAKRVNHTYRPNRPLSPLEEAQSVGQLRKISNKGHNAKLNLFLEVELGVSRPFFPPAKTKDDILLFFKLFDPVKEKLRYVGRLFVKALGYPAEIRTKLNEMAGFSPNEEIELYEEIMFEPSVMCEHIDKKLNFISSQLEDGDIICYQKCSHGSNDQCRYPDVPSFLEYVHNRQQHGEMEAAGEGEGTSSKLTFKWNDEMDACLTTSLIEQMEKEFKEERSFTNVAYNAACHVLEKTFETKFTIEHVKHRLKILENQLAAFQDMQNSTGGFLFNEVTKMMDAEPTVWDAYLKAHPNAKQYRCKPLPSFENLLIIFGKYRASGHGSNTAKKRRVHMEREQEEMNIDDQDPLLPIEKKSSTETNGGSIGIQVDETTASKDEFQMLKSGMNVVVSAVNRSASCMVITEELLFEEVLKIDGLSEFSKIIAYDFLCDEVTRGKKFIGLPLAYRKQWLEFKLGKSLE